MQIQYVSKYIALSEEGLVPGLKCPMDQGSLLCNLDLNDTIYLYCLSCNYKNNIGLEVYTKLVELIKNEI
jgi:hypothetical protein